MARIKYTITVALLALCLLNTAQTTPWLVSGEEAGKTNPLKVEPKNLALGRNIFKRSCVACHGEKADGKGLIPSTSLIDTAFQKQTDGAVFHKISTGRDKMPPFSAMMKEDEIWSVINYLRVLVDPSAIPPPKNVKLEVITGTDIKSITASILSADSLKKPLAEVDVHFFVKTDFGLMRVGEPSNYTGADGKVKTVFPENITGDAEGNVKLVVKIENNFLYNDTEVLVEKNWGKPLVSHEDDFKRRSLWGARDKSPVWLLLLANGILVSVWAVILFVIINLFRIKKEGRIFLK